MKTIETKHTPGEWNVQFYPSMWDGIDYYYLINRGKPCTKEEALSNKKLIEAAPEMLEALKQLCDLEDLRGTGHMPTVKYAKDVIKKATA